jgi:acyl carrier protein
MTKQEVFEGLKEVLSVIRPKADLSTVDYDTELIRGLGIDSLTMMLLSLAAEDKFQVRFPVGQAPFKTVGEVCDNILSLSGQE